MARASGIPDLAAVERAEIRLSGFGGQGILLAGYILGEAATLFSKRNVVMAQSYGPESRGGASQVELILAASEISYPRIESPDVVVTLSQQAYASYGLSRPHGCLLLADSDLVSIDQTVEEGQVTVLAPLTRWAEERLGKRITANIVMLAYLCDLTGLVEASELERAVARSAPRGSEELNRRAVEIGIEEAQTYLASLDSDRP